MELCAFLQLAILIQNQHFCTMNCKFNVLLRLTKQISDSETDESFKHCIHNTKKPCL